MFLGLLALDKLFGIGQLKAEPRRNQVDDSEREGLRQVARSCRRNGLPVLHNAAP